MSRGLTAQDFADAAQMLGVDVAAVRAVDSIESLGRGFHANGEPVILFERHKFHRHTGGRFDDHPDISSPKPGGYGASSRQHARLREAVELDRDAALKSASWGRFQILGENYEQAGFDTLQSFINAMYRDERSQLMAFVRFVLNDPVMARALRQQDWVTFAERYNGPAQAKHNYSGRLAQAHRRFASHA
jgi:hypothetical protein